MTKRRGVLTALLVGVAASAVLVGVGDRDGSVGLGSVAEIWADFVWDVDRSALSLTRLSDEEEMRVGADLAMRLGGPPPERAALAAYVADVGAALVPFVERGGIEYRFYVVESRSVNAFALPGGHVAVTTEMLDRLIESEAELAAVLGHEMAHVDRRHCIERYQYILQLRKVGAGSVGFITEMLRRFVALGYKQYQEAEADEEGLRLAMAAGYDPTAGPPLFERMATQDDEPAGREAGTVATEAVGSLGDLIGSYGRSHPPSRQRDERLRNWLYRHRRQIDGRSFYVGRVNFEQKVARSVEAIEDELVVR